MAAEDPPHLAGRSLRATLSPLLTACLVAAPLAVGIGVGHNAAGARAALGAYLWTVGTLSLRRPISSRVLGFTAVLFGVAGATGALAGQQLWLLVVLTAVWATFQAVADTAGGILRMPAGMAALCFLLSAMGGGTSPRGALWRGVLVLGGASWMVVWDVVRHPPWRSSTDGSRTLGISELRAAWPRSRRFALLLAVPTMLSAGLVGLFEISHGAWMATTVLRVLRPEASATLVRSGQRIVGTSAGAVMAAVLFGTVSHELTAVIVLVTCLWGMQLVGPKRYGTYTFFLTLLALELASVGQPTGWRVALVRVALTVAGAAVAVVSGLLYDRPATRRPTS
jgi:Fusaric acid resistance protein-like